MEMKDVGRIIGATALAVIPAAGGLYAFGKSKDKKNSTGASALIGGLTLTILGVGVALVNYYMLGLNETAEQLTTLIDEKKAGTVGALLPNRVYSPFGDNFRKLGLLNVTRLGRVGMLDVQQRQRVGCCGR